MFIIGSGNSYHNVGNMFNPTRKAISGSAKFDESLKSTLSLDVDRRRPELLRWASAPAARNDPAMVTWSGTINGTVNTAFHFQESGR